MPNTQIALGGWTRSYLQANDTHGTGRSVSSLTVTIDNYAVAYVAPGGDGVGSFAIVPKTVPTGVTTVNVTVNAKDLEGNALPALVIPYDVHGTSPDPLATTLVLLGSSNQVGGQPADPGSATATLV